MRANGDIDFQIEQLLQQIETLQNKCSNDSSTPATLGSLKKGLEELRYKASEIRQTRIGEEALRQIISQSPDFIFLQDRDLRYTWISSKNPFGREASDILGKNDIPFLDPDDVKRLKEVKEQVIKTGNKARVEVHANFQGVEHYFDSIYYPWRNASGEIAGLAGYVRDVTEQKIAEIEIKKMTKAVETAPTAIVLTDLEGRIVYVNPSLLENSGFSHMSETINASVFDFTSIEGKTKLQEEILPALLASGQWRGELPIKRKDGKIYISEMICALVKDDYGKPRYFLANFYNITDRKRAEEALLLDDSRLEALQKLNQMDEASLQEISDFALEAGVKLTGSKLGYMAFMEDDEKTLVMHSWSKKAMQDCEIDQKKWIYPLEETGLWGEAVRQRKAVITNDYLGCAMRKGTPKGHVKITRHMNVPIIDKGKIVIVAGVGNKDDEYDDADVRQLTLLMSGMWKILQPRITEDELRARDHFLQGVARATNYLLTPDPYAVKTALGILGEAADVDQIQILEKIKSNGSECLRSLELKWRRNAAGHPSKDEMNWDIPWQDNFPGWYEILAHGNIVQGTISRLSVPGKGLMDNSGIKSFLIVPTFIEGQFFAVVCFNDCHSERHWNDNERAILQATAGSISEAILRRRTERALRESQRTLSTLMSNLPGMAYRCRNDSHWTMEFVSDGSLELTGYRAEDLIQNRTISYADLIYPEDREYVWNTVQEGISKRKPFRMTYRIKAGESVKWVWEQGQGIFTGNGELLALEGFINDITDRKLAEESLKKTQEELEKRVRERTAWLLRANTALQEEMVKNKETERELRRARQAADAASQAKSEFLANMSHEIRTPMNAVIGLAGLLLETELTAEQRDYVETIHSSGDALLAIINDILDFSKIDEGKMKLEDQPFDLHESIESSLDMVAAKAAEKGLNLTYKVDKDVPKTLRGDSARLRQILANLLSNAVKFTEKGSVEVSAKPGEQPGEIHFSVSDTGIGISSEDMGKLFKSFSQVDASTSRKYGGTGLGLAISKRLVELMSGRIWALSEPGKGSVFHFQIKSYEYNGEVPDLLLKGRKIMVLVSSEDCLKGLVRHARRWGMQIYPTVTAKEARELAKIRFDAAILDMDVPGAKELHEDLQKSMPTITLISQGQRRSSRTALTKPVTPSLLKTTLQETLLPKNQNTRRVSSTRTKQKDIRILLAEDNQVNQKVALLMLKKLGYKADVAANGKEVLQALERQPYDVILMDVQMPEMDGLEATRAIRRSDLKKRPKILAMTAYALEGDKERCLEAGMDGYISKPVQIEELKTVLESLQSDDSAIASL
ncbi:Methyl sulfide methyltransferase-associated sensor [uncultured archaeon]|nr:Methyl sulfide methyltransferase-associated sensor [uncultured archaeon]